MDRFVCDPYSPIRFKNEPFYSREPLPPLYGAGAAAPDLESCESKDTAEPQQLSPNTLKVAAAECLNSWIGYLQVIFYIY